MSTDDRVQDPDRIRALHATGLLEGAGAPSLDRVTRLAVRWLPVPIAMVSLVDADRQVVVSSAGPAGPWCEGPVPLSQSLCRHIVATGAALTVPDVPADDRWHAVRAAGDGLLKAYAGVPLHAGRHVLGALCAIDTAARTWSAEQLAALDDLAAVAESEIDHGRCRTEARRLAVLLDSLDEGVIACDADGRLVQINQPMREILQSEQRPDDPRAWASAYGLFDPDGRRPLEPGEVPLARALDGEHTHGQEVMVCPPGRPARRIAVNARPIDAPDGRRLGAVATGHDVTDSHRTALLRAAQHAVIRALAEDGGTEEAATRVIAALGGALGWCCGEYWQVDDDQASITRIASWSKPGRDLTAFAGLQPLALIRGEGLPGRVWAAGRRIWTPDPQADPHASARPRQARGTELRAAIGLPVHGGQRMLGVLTLFSDSATEPDEELADLLDGVCAYLGRYVERRRADDLTRTLEIARYRFDRVIAQIDDYVWTSEALPDGRFRLLYRSPNTVGVLGSQLPDIDIVAVLARYVHPDDQEAFEAFNAALAAGRAVQAEYRLTGIDGVTRWVWSRAAPRRDGGRLLVDGITTDVTERRELADERERLLAREQEQVHRLQELDRLKDELMAMVSHELRSPIGVIRAYAEMLCGAPDLPEEHSAFLEVIDRKSEHLQRLVDDLLDLARLEDGRLSVEARTVWLTRLIRQAVDDHRAAAAAKDVTLTAELPHHLQVRADPVRLRQVMDNLLSNAIKYTPGGGTVAVTAVPPHGGDGGSPRMVAVTVADSGIGIPAEQYEHLFSRFFRASSARAAGIKGTGLGLAITRAIVNAHGGTITAAPREGGGTAFTVRLPVG
ncbi:ATP-binding protein [Planomonospora sp. ID82291]|uniref:ATP-binding protein n=1 Tax=Planomonospora sp. ID82291 TaxID=2738136 RepID=UPI0018C3B57B|nr:ATP-binding protein [Planomonospora sp. ID82291]MBG0815657.1 GAF domain-containing protein [Planomonospora sp. ID82291]